MNATLKMVLGIIAGVAIGGFINFNLIKYGPMIIPPPEGVDVTNIDSIIENMHLYKAKNFIMPFLAHALGTLVGAFIAAKIAGVHQMKLGLAIGAFFLLGGIYMVRLLPSTMWFNVLDLVGAYLPMGWLGAKLADNNSIGQSQIKLNTECF